VGDQRDAPLLSLQKEAGGWSAGHPLSNSHNPNHTIKLKRKRVCSKGRRDHKQKTTLNNGYLGSRIDEERSEMRYVV
jgi:hypothetical protein